MLNRSAQAGNMKAREILIKVVLSSYSFFLQIPIEFLIYFLRQMGNKPVFVIMSPHRQKVYESIEKIVIPSYDNGFS